MARENYPHSTWRLLLESQPKSGALNMAIDEAVLRAVAEGRAPPTLRIYAWAAPALTLGRGQPVTDADLTALEVDGVTLLRRATGGTAVYHDKTELTYTAAVQSHEVRFKGGIAESYRSIGAALVHALEQLGLSQASATPHAENRQSRSKRDPVCFLLPSDYEITVGGRKLVGSAQMRIRDGILQHGSLYLRGDIANICPYLSAHPKPEHVRARALTLSEALHEDITWDIMAEAMVNSFREILNLDFVSRGLVPEERTEAARLLREKYVNDAWTYRL